MKTKFKVENYKEIEGFYDLRLFEIDNKTFLKLWKMQRYLFNQNKHREYFKKFEKTQWKDLKEVSAEYQQILL